MQTISAILRTTIANGGDQHPPIGAVQHSFDDLPVLVCQRQLRDHRVLIRMVTDAHAGPCVFVRVLDSELLESTEDIPTITAPTNW